MQTGLDEAQQILELGLDKLVQPFKGTDFYQEYWSARKSINTAARHESPTVATAAAPAAAPANPAAPGAPGH